MLSTFFHEAFSLSMPWWAFVARALIVYFTLLLMIRMSGKRTMGQFTPFDMLLVVLLGNTVQNAMIGDDISVGGGLLLAATMIAVNWLVGWLSSRNGRIESLIEGVPVLLARDGQVFKDVLRRELISHADFAKSMRAAGCEDVGDISLAVLETDGHITLALREKRGQQGAD